MKLFLIFSIFCAPCHPLSLPLPDDQPLDCAIRLAAHDYAVQVQGHAQTTLFDALALSSYCGIPPPSLPTTPPVSPLLPSSSSTFFADASLGSDDNPGTAGRPFKSLARGVSACRSAAPGCALLLTDTAPFVLTQPLVLDAADSGLVLAAAPGASPVVTSAAPVAAWAPLRISAGENVWRAALTPGAPLPRALLVSGRRLPRARWPNAVDWETDRVPVGYTNASSWAAPRPAPPATPARDAAAARPYDVFFPNFTWATGGVAADFFEPPEGYWVSPHPAGGDTFAVPSGLSFTPSRWSPRVGKWNVSSGGGAVVKCFHGEYWGSWAFELAHIDADAGVAVFGKGGWQEARGWKTGGALYVENIAAELDAPSEWFADGDAGTVDLFWNASSGTPPPPGVVSLAALENLITIAGTADAPARDIVFAGLTFTGTQPTYLSTRFVAPSGGDWSFADAAAIKVTGAVGVRISASTFSGLGGNALLLRGWNRGVVIENSTFDRIGDSAIVSAGRATLADLSALDVPVGTRITGSTFSNLGVDVKQSGGVYSALTANMTIDACVFFSLPRAAININDGAHGGHLITRNVFAQTVLETADHGSLNTWDRQPYIQTYDPTARIPLVSRIERNFFINQGFGIHPCDHDDGSANYADSFNVLAFAGFKNYLGFKRTWTSNLVIRPDFLAVPPSVPTVTPEGVPLPVFYYFPACVRSLGQAAWGALADLYTHNTCILDASVSAYIYGKCNPAAPSVAGDVPRASNNTFLVRGGAVEIACGGKALSLSGAQAVGYELGSVEADSSHLSPADIAAMVRNVLGY